MCMMREYSCFSIDESFPVFIVFAFHQHIPLGLDLTRVRLWYHVVFGIIHLETDIAKFGAT